MQPGFLTGYCTLRLLPTSPLYSPSLTLLLPQPYTPSLTLLIGNTATHQCLPPFSPDCLLSSSRFNRASSLCASQRLVDAGIVASAWCRVCVYVCVRVCVGCGCARVYI